MMASGGDYSPNSHTFFKHPNNASNPCLESLQGSGTLLPQ